MKLLTETNTTLLNISLLLLRCTVGIILFLAGAGKVSRMVRRPGNRSYHRYLRHPDGHLTRSSLT